MPDSLEPVLTTVTRRGVLGGAATVAIGLLAGCGSDSGEDGPGDGNGNAGGNGAGTVVGDAADVPVGGGRIFQGAQVVVAQPSAGEFTAFTAVCTHENCLVSSVSQDTIDCACHGSQYSLADGSVLRGPAVRPLSEVEITVENGEIRLA